MQPRLTTRPGASTGRSYTRLLVPVAVAAAVGWFLFSRHAPPAGAGAAPEVPAPASSLAPAIRALPPPGAAPGTPAAAPGSAGSAAPEDQAGAAGAASPPVTPGVAGADERQLVKIARGLEVGADGALRVTSTPPGSVVGQLHLQPGDVLLSVNGQPVATPADFARLYREQGLPSELTLLRGGREIHRR